MSKRTPSDFLKSVLGVCVSMCLCVCVCVSVCVCVFVLTLTHSLPLVVTTLLNFHNIDRSSRYSCCHLAQAAFIRQPNEAEVSGKTLVIVAWEFAW